MESLKNNGIDDGKGAQKLLTSYVDEVLGMVKPPTANSVPEHITEKNSFKSATFFEKLHRQELKDVPLVSQAGKSQEVEVEVEVEV